MSAPARASSGAHSRVAALIAILAASFNLRIGIVAIGPIIEDIRARDHRRVAELSAWMLGIGYLLSGVSPILTGALRDATGSFTTPMVLLACLGIVAGVLALVIPRREPAGP